MKEKLLELIRYLIIFILIGIMIIGGIWSGCRLTNSIANNSEVSQSETTR